MKFNFWKSVNSDGISIILNEFEPQGGYELFLKELCAFLGEKFLGWHQGIESGIGDITYEGYKLTVFWTDFPFSLSFDCRDQNWSAVFVLVTAFIYFWLVKMRVF